MREKDYYINEINSILNKYDIDTVKAVYIALNKMKGGNNHGIQKINN